MKLKQRPEDFRVTELDKYDLAKTGPFVLYRLEKWDIGTIEAVRNIAKNWKLSRDRISFGGLKDRHARCEQMISIRGGPEKNFDGSSFLLRCLGRSRDPITRASFDANRFEIVVRHLNEIPNLEPIKLFGIPNYFDDQRFGSLRGTNGEFIGKALVKGDNEKALKMAIAAPSGKDRKKARDLKILLQKRWGDWGELQHQLPHGSERNIASFLARRPGAFGHAFELIDQDLKILYVSAYQSYIWNRTLGAMLRRLPEWFEVDYVAGRHVFYDSLTRKDHDRLAELTIPLMTPSQKFEGEIGEHVTRILKEDKVEPRHFRLKKLGKTFFGKGQRAAIIAPGRFKSKADNDDINKGKKKLTLSFDLPKGSYATVMVKRLFHVPVQQPDTRDVNPLDL